MSPLLQLVAVLLIPTVVIGQSALFSEAARWTKDRVHLEGGELTPQKGAGWSEGWLHFAEPIEVTSEPLLLRFSVRTDRAQGEDAGAVYAKLHFSRDSTRREQVSLNACVRPSPRWFMLYVDPGWQMPNRHYLTVVPPPGLFRTTSTQESFVVRLRREGEFIVATLAAQLRPDDTAQVLKTEQGISEVRASIVNDLEGHTTIKSLSFQFPGDFSVVSGVFLQKEGGRSMKEDGGQGTVAEGGP